jgi:serine/threonine-protein kinase
MNNVPVALKIIKGDGVNGEISRRQREFVENEAIILNRANHPHVITCYGFFVDGNQAVLVLELAKSSVWNVLRDTQTFPVIPDVLKLCWLVDLCVAMQYLHSKGVVHKDIKCDNALVVTMGPIPLRIKLGDFGLAKMSMTYAGVASTAGAGTISFMAPELRGGQHASAASDVFALGMTLIQLLARQVLSVDNFTGSIANAIRSVNPTSVVYQSVQELEGLLAVMLAVEPTTRPKVGEVYNSLSSIVSGCGGDPRLRSSCTDYRSVLDIDNILTAKVNGPVILKMPSETPISGLTDHAASSPIQSTVEDKKTRMVQAIMTFLDKHV